MNDAADMYEPSVPVTVAKRVSVCELCEHRILVGEEIVLVDGSWMHVDCGREWER